MNGIKIVLFSILVLVTLSTGTFSFNDAFAALDSKGTEFLIALQPNLSGSNFKTQLHLASDSSTQVTVNYPVNNPIFTSTVQVNPGQITIVDLPLDVQSWQTNGPSDNVIKVTSTNEITVYTSNIRDASSDAALALPTDVFSFKYIVAAYKEAFYWSQFTVVSNNDNTKVTITPTVNLSSGQSAGIPFEITLNKGEGAHYQSSGKNDLSGTVITADKPIGMTNGNRCTQVPLGVTACDHLYEHAIPVQGWGTQVLVSDLPQRPSGSIYRVFASLDNTQVSIDGNLISTIANEGGFYETNFLSGGHVISGNKPIFVVQYMTGQNSPGASSGDPAMANIIPTEQFLNSYTFSTVGGGQFTQHFVSIIASNSDLNSIKLDGNLIGSGAFTAIPGTSYSSTSTFLSQGTHTTSAPNGHGILVGGYKGFDSYLYPGGAAFEFINPQPEDDRDGDGIPDINDECPDEFAETANGCPLQCEEPQQTSVFYDFNGEGLPEEFSGITTTESVLGYQNYGFDGQFLRNPTNPPQNSTLTLTNLPPHDTIDIGFLLAAIDSWDSDDGSCCTPDYFNVSVDGVTVFNSTHNNALGTNDYADENPEALLVLQQQLGWRNDNYGNDSGYDLNKESKLKGIAHTSDTLTINFFASGSGWQGGNDESWAIDNLQVTTHLSTPICEPGVEIRTKNAGDNQWDTRPTFGISHEDRQNQVVENGFRFNNNEFTLTDNHWTPFEEQSVEIGTVNSFSATVYADKQLKIQEFLFGIPNVGEAEKAELGVEVWYDFNGEIQDVKVVQKSNVIDADTISVSHEKVKCLSTDSESKCDNTTVSMKFLEPLKDKVMAIKAIDFKNRDQRTFLNEGFNISGKSLNPMLSKMIPSNIRDAGLIQVTQLEKYSPYWVAEDGRMFEMNSFGSFKQINQQFERFQDKGNAFTRMHSGFDGIIDYEKNRATQVFDASMYISELPDSFGHHIVIHDRMTDELKQNMLQQEQIAKGILEQMDKQTRHN